MQLNPLEKLIITSNRKRQNGRVIGMKVEKNGSITYIIEPLRVDFSQFVKGSRLMKITSTEIENNKVSIEKHNI